METLSERLTSRGWRMTAQRRVIAGVFDAGSQDDPTDHDHIHLSADEVHELAVRVLPEISRATVYNTLGEMVDAGELLAVHVGDRVTRYDPNVHESHHHLVCSVCGSIQDIPATPTPVMPTGSTGFVIESADVIYRGRCVACVTKL